MDLLQLGWRQLNSNDDNESLWNHETETDPKTSNRDQ